MHNTIPKKADLGQSKPSGFDIESLESDLSLTTDLIVMLSDEFFRMDSASIWNNDVCALLIKNGHGYTSELCRKYKYISAIIFTIETRMEHSLSQLGQFIEDGIRNTQPES